MAPPDRVQIWSSQLVANDFPPVCVMTGKPAETWRRFNFVTAPAWAYALLVIVCTGIGLLPVFIIMRLVSRTAGGHMPLSSQSAKAYDRARSIGVSIFLAVGVLWAAGLASIAIVGSSGATNTIAGLAFSLGLLAGLVGGAYWLIVRPRFGPQGKVMASPRGQLDRLVELRNVHPNFVAAVQQQHAARAAQLAAPV